MILSKWSVFTLMNFSCSNTALCLLPRPLSNYFYLSAQTRLSHFPLMNILPIINLSMQTSPGQRKLLATLAAGDNPMVQAVTSHLAWCLHAPWWLLITLWNLHHWLCRLSDSVQHILNTNQQLIRLPNMMMKCLCCRCLCSHWRMSTSFHPPLSL